jgi:hypothetical protein
MPGIGWGLPDIFGFFGNRSVPFDERVGVCA